MSAVAEALLEAHKSRASGWMTLTFWGRESKLLLKGGDLVGAQMGFGHQSVLQGLLQSKRLSLTQLDALWARGDAGKADAETLEEVGASASDSSTHQVLAQVRRLATLAAKVKFEEGDVAASDAPVRGVEAVRAAFESVARLDGEPKVFRCTDLTGCADWLVTDEERALLADLTEFKNPGKLPLTQRVLLELLEREGKVESVLEEEFLARLQEEERDRAREAARLAEEKRKAEEAARVAEEQRKAEEAARLAEEKRRAAEEARAAEERRLAEEEARLAEERRAAEEAERLAREERIAEEERRAQEARQKAEEEAKAAEAARLAEQQRLEEEQRAAEAAEQQRREEEQRTAEAEAARVAEEQRLAEEKRALEEQRLAEEKRVAEEQRLAEEKRAEEEQRLAEEKRVEEEQRLAEEMRLAEEKRVADEARLAEEAQKAEEQRVAEEAQKTEEQRVADEKRREDEEERSRLAADAAAAAEARIAQERRFGEEMKRAKEARRLEEQRLAEERRRVEEEAAAAEAQRKAEEEAHLAEERRRAQEEEQRLADEKAREEEEARLREQERLAAERILREDEERRVNEARIAAERAAEEARLEQERLLREQEERAEAEARLAEQRKRYEEERAAEAAAMRDMSPDGWFTPGSAAPSMPTGPLRLSSPPVEPEVPTVPEAIPEAVIEEPPTLEAEVIDAEVDVSPAPARAEPPVARGPVPMEQATAAASSDADRLNLAKHRAQADLLRELNEALRRSATGFKSDPAPPKSEPPVPAPTWSPPPPPPAPAPMKQPLILGPQGSESDSGGGDLWSLVKPAAPNARPPGGVASFEEALKRVDASLEQLVESPQSSGSEPPAEATVEAVVENASSEQAGMEGDLADPSDPNDAAKARRQRLLRRAMENLGAIPSNRPASSSATTDPDLPAVNVAQRVEPKANANTPKATSDDLQLKAQVEQRWDELRKRRELYHILAVPLGGGKDQVKAAFLTLAKIFHPDRLPPSLPELAPKMQTVFESIREAYETLYDDGRRAAYMSSLASGNAQKPPSQSPGSDPAELMKQGEIHFKKREYRLAEEVFAKAHGLDKTGTSLSAQAWAIYMDPSRKAEAANAKQMMSRAIGLDPNSDRAHYQLGVIARVEGDMERAERHFRDAVRINPRHLEANQEIRLIEMRKKKGTSPKGGGFFSR